MTALTLKCTLSTLFDMHVLRMSPGPCAFVRLDQTDKCDFAARLDHSWRCKINQIELENVFNRRDLAVGSLSYSPMLCFFGGCICRFSCNSWVRVTPSLFISLGIASENIKRRQHPLPLSAPLASFSVLHIHGWRALSPLSLLSLFPPLPFLYFPPRFSIPLCRSLALFSFLTSSSWYRYISAPRAHDDNEGDGGTNTSRLTQRAAVMSKNLFSY